MTCTGASQNGKAPVVVLGDDADEALEAAVDGVVDDDRPLEAAIGGAVLEVEALRQLVVGLDGGHLPLAAERVLDEDVDLRRVERAAALVERVGHAVLVESLAQPALGSLPELVRPEALLRSGGQLRARLEAERGVLLAHQRQGEAQLVVDLVVPAEDVGVVLRQLAHPEHPGQDAGALLAEQDRVVGEADRQLAVRVRARLVDQDLLRAVHRLQAGHVVVVVEHEHVVLVVAPVAARLPQLLAHEARRADLVEAGLAAHLARPVLERAPEGHAARVQEGRGRRLGVEREQVQLATELAVVALLRLLQAPQVLVQLLLVLSQAVP